MKKIIILVIGLMMFCTIGFADPAIIESINVSSGNKEVYIPEVTNLGNMNHQINDVIGKEYSNFLNEFSKLNDPTDVRKITYDVTLNTDNLLSVKLNEYWYDHRAVHGNAIQKSFTFNTKTGNLLTLNDLFANSSDYIYTLNSAIKYNLSHRQIEFISPYTGVTKDQEFYLTTESLVLYYQEGEYTAIAYGAFQIPIPYTLKLNYSTTST